MDPERSRKIEALYEAALGLASERRAAFLKDACGGDEPLRREVESLLASDENAGSFLEVPLLGRLPDIGHRVSHYEIQKKLGEGGMGVVYKARDTRLGRSVALKFVKAQFSERFEREARAIAALNHPHIATLHDVGEHEGAPYLAMEFVEGRALKGPRPVKEVIEYGIQIADALAMAHAAGIVHRDLKPANILVTEKGSIKILDFGIAKLTGQALDGQPVTATLTGIGAGTPGYMSPEQIDGRHVDSRSDIFAFGCVLYELVSGRHAFEGDSITQVLAATATQEPKPLSGVPEELEKLIRRCLRKDPEHRLHHIADARIALEELRDESGKPAPAVQAPVSGRSYRKLAWTMLALLAAAALGTGLWLAFDGGAAVPPPRVVPMTAFAGWELDPAFSPDGKQVAFRWNGEKQDNADIYVMMVGSATALRLTSDPAVDRAPAWSPDGRQIAFVSARGQSGIYLVSPIGGPERKLFDVAASGRPSWSPDGKFLVVSRAYRERGEWSDNGAVLLIPAEGGESRRMLAPQPGYWYQEPTFSPDGRQLAVASCTGSVSLIGVTSCQLEIWALDAELLPEGKFRVIASPVVAPSGMAWTGDANSLVVGAMKVAGSSPSAVQYLWRVPVGEAGTPQRLELAGSWASGPAIDAKNCRLAFQRFVWEEHIWRWEQGGKPSLLLASSRLDRAPQFSRDGRRIAFRSQRAGEDQAVWVANADGTGWVQITTGESGSPRWSPDDRWIAFDARGKNGRWDISVAEASGGPVRQLTHGPADNAVPSWSRDGKWIYFYSNRSGRAEIWRIPVQGGAAEQITRRGGHVAFESTDGKTIFYSKSDSGAEGLFEVSLAGGEERQTLKDPVLGRGFTVFSDGIYYITGQGPSPEIRFHEFASGRSRRIVALEGPLTLGLSVSPDRKTFLFTRQVVSTSDLMLIENFR